MYGQLALPGLTVTPDDDGDQLSIFDALAEIEAGRCTYCNRTDTQLVNQDAPTPDRVCLDHLERVV